MQTRPMEVTSKLSGTIHVLLVAFSTRFFLPPQGYQKEDRDHEPYTSPESILCYVLVMAHLHLVPEPFTGMSKVPLCSLSRRLSTQIVS